MIASENNFDVIIVGGGISGVNAAYRLQESHPDLTYTILESRDVMGGTWSLFQYPGIRSDSDLHNFGFPFDPWKEDKSIADGASILKYLNTVAARHGIDQHVQFKHKVMHMDWRSDIQQWRAEVVVDGSEKKTMHARFVYWGTGYYDYSQGAKAKIPGLDNFKGKIVHPQFWPKDLDYTNKNLVIIGSGATAVTILPAVADKTKHVTMLQRSPGYFISLPTQMPIDKFIRAIFPINIAFAIIRLRLMLLTFIFYNVSRLFPERTKKTLRGEVAKLLPPDTDLDKDFLPNYMPWDQRMCIVPDGDFFKPLRENKASVATGHIETMTDNAIVLKDGRRLEDVDIIVTATGLRIQIIGGASVSIDGKQINYSDKFVWRGMCLQDVPNLAFAFGYTNNAWTLGSDASARTFARLVKRTRAKDSTSFVPTVSKGEEMTETPMLDLNSGYIKDAVDRKVLPKTATHAPWKPRWHYFQDNLFAMFGNVEKGMNFNRVAT